MVYIFTEQFLVHNTVEDPVDITNIEAIVRIGSTCMRQIPSLGYGEFILFQLRVVFTTINKPSEFLVHLLQ